MKQRGFSLIIAGLIALAVLSVLTGVAWKIRESGKDAIRIEWAQKNEQRVKENERDRETRNAITDKREAENATKIAALDRKYRAALLGLRNRSTSNNATQPLSEAASRLARPDRSADVAGGLERLETGVLGLLERGDKAIIRSAECKAWLDDQLKVKPN